MTGHLQSPLAQISQEAVIGAGTVIEAGAVIGPLARIGANCRIEAGAYVGYAGSSSAPHPTVLGDRVLVATNAVIYHSTLLHDDAKVRHNAVIREEVEIGAGTSIGINSTIEHHSKIGRGCSLHVRTHLTDYSCLGDYVFIGPGLLSFSDLNLDFRRPQLHQEYKGLTIGDGARLGGAVIALPGTIVGAEAVIGAGSTISGKLLERMVYVGAPARAIRRVPKEHEVQQR
jgi:UDP-3-O-[3-hydroxymyristoyl] glucosamine N-acyltransferase